VPVALFCEVPEDLMSDGSESENEARDVEMAAEVENPAQAAAEPADEAAIVEVEPPDALVAALRPRDRWDNFDVWYEGKYFGLLKYGASGILSAHCTFCENDAEGPKHGVCRINRTTAGGRSPGQGRPAGFWWHG
jgi:hypothetical protein